MQLLLILLVLLLQFQATIADTLGVVAPVPGATTAAPTNPPGGYQMGISTRSKSKLSTSSDVEDQSSCKSVHSVKLKVNNSGNVKGNNSGKVKGKKSGNAAKSIVGKQHKKKAIDKAVSEAVGAKQVGSMAAILESTEEDK